MISKVTFLTGSKASRFCQLRRKLRARCIGLVANLRENLLGELNGLGWGPRARW